VIDNYQNSAQVIHGLSHDPVLRLILGTPVTGKHYRGIRVEAVFTSESEITTNAAKYNDYVFACIISVNDMHYTVGQVKDDPDSIILSEIDHSVTYAGKVIFAGIV
jgi:hypothetical protein